MEKHGVCHTTLPWKVTGAGRNPRHRLAHLHGGRGPQFATGSNPTRASSGDRKLLINLATMRFLSRRHLPGRFGYDVILHVIGDIGFRRDVSRHAVEGPAYAMNMDDRMTIANMAIEAGGKNGIFPFDEKTDAYVKERIAENGTKSSYEPVEIDREQTFSYDKTFDLTKLEPTVACHPDPGQRKTAKELSNVSLDRAYIGSCTGGKTSDFRLAHVVKGKSVKIDILGVPATTKVVQELRRPRFGAASAFWSILESAGVRMTENPCAARPAARLDTFGRMNTPDEVHQRRTAIFRPHGATRESQVFLASPTPSPRARSPGRSPTRGNTRAERRRAAARPDGALLRRLLRFNGADEA
jgi:3-isopropylmalate/(R)-2-methylmalate dehydratase large subunit